MTVKPKHREVLKNSDYERLIDLGDKQIHDIEPGGIEHRALMRHRGPTVYVIRCEKYFKIGMTNGSIGSRLETLQVGNPYELELVLAFKTLNARAMEEKLHARFSHKRIRREWFELNSMDFGELEEFIKELWV